MASIIGGSAVSSTPTFHGFGGGVLRQHSKCACIEIFLLVSCDTNASLRHFSHYFKRSPSGVIIAAAINIALNWLIKSISPPSAVRGPLATVDALARRGFTYRPCDGSYGLI